MRLALVPALLAAGAVLALCAAAGAAAAATAAEGAVTFEDGSPAANARVTLVPGGYNTTADAAGGFRIEAPPGTYTIRASAANTTVEAQVVLEAGMSTNVTLRITRVRPGDATSPVFAFVFLGVAMVAVAAGGFYVNKRMAERGIDLNKSVAGGATLRKPFRRRRKKPKAP